MRRFSLHERRNQMADSHLMTVHRQSSSESWPLLEHHQEKWNRKFLEELARERQLYKREK